MRQPRRDRDPSLEDAVEAYEDGDRPVRMGPARAALGNRTFRVVFVGAFLSSTGRWMQNVVLGALAYDLTGSPTFVGVVLFAQLGPLLLFSMAGGVLADLVDRRRLLVSVACTQAVLSFVLAAVAGGDDPPKVALVGVVFLIGTGQAVFGPTYSAVLPTMVDRRHLAGAISLHSAQMNGARVLGPAIGSLIDARLGAAAVFVVTGLSYVFVITSLLWATLPPVVPSTDDDVGWRRLVSGFRVASRDPVVARSLISVFVFSLLSLPFIGQLPTLAERNLGIDARSTQYGLLYAAFGLGALLGALSIGTVLSSLPREVVVRRGLGTFAVVLGVLGLLRSPGIAYPVVVVVGFAYFAVITSLSTVIQERVSDESRGRVMAIWVMAFGGTVPIGNLVAGPLIEWTSMTAVVLAGAAVALGLAAYARRLGKDEVAIAPAP